MMLKVGVVGLGMMGLQHARVYSELDCQLVAVADVDPVLSKAVGERYGVEYYTNYADLAEKVDAVSIVVPTTLHREVASHFLAHGIHCLVEKPIASTIEDAVLLTKIAQDSGAKLAVGYIERFNPAVAKLKEITTNGTLGQLIMISARRVGPFSHRITDVGIIFDSASHDIDVVRYLIGKEPLSMFARANRFQHVKAEDHAALIMDFGTTIAMIEANWFTPHKVRVLAVTGSEGVAYLDYINQAVTVHNADGEWKVPIDKAEPLSLELAHFLQCIKTDAPPLVGGYEGIQTLTICMMAIQEQRWDTPKPEVAQRSGILEHVQI